MNANKKSLAEKLRQLEAAGIALYSHGFRKTYNAGDVVQEFAHLQPEEIAEQEVRLCGRILRERFSWRFVDLADESGCVQLVFQQPHIELQAMKLIKLLDRGDLIGVVGKPMRTRSGPPSVLVTQWQLLSKCMHNLPEDASFLSNPEVRYRQRHLDLMLSPDARNILRKRSHTIRATREFLDERDFLEVETPILHVQAGGAEAKPFVTHHNALDTDMHLRIAPEFYLRRLMVGGFEKVYEIGKNFRNEGISPRHSPEFTSIELFQAYGDYRQLMDLTEALLRHVVTTVSGGTCLAYEGQQLDFGKPFRRLSMTDAIKEYCGIDVIATGMNGEAINDLFEQRVQPLLIQPTFIIDYPVEVSVCQQLHPTKDGYVERFELFVFGRELANGCSELNDPREQRRRFAMQAQRKQMGNHEIPEADMEFAESMEYGMPPMMGLGIGMDRLIMLIVDAKSIRDVIAFPTVKPLHRKLSILG